MDTRDSVDLAASVTALARWYARPLGAEDGNSREEIAAVESRLGVTLPRVLIEWYRLVGRRLRSTQDSPVLLDDLVVVDGAVPVWHENQGVWTIVAPLGEDDPICRAGSDVRGPLSSVLVGMLASDTLVSVWGRSYRDGGGPLGELADSVRGGYIDDFDEDAFDRLDDAFLALPWVQNPFFAGPFRGDATTLVRAEDVAIEWATATDVAFAALGRVIELEPEGGAYEVRLRFAHLSAAQRELLGIDAHGIVSAEVIAGFLDGTGRIARASAGDAPEVDVATREPDAVLGALLSRMPEQLLQRVTIDSRPAAISSFTRRYPTN